MSVRYIAVNWNRQKRAYDLTIATAVAGLVALFFLVSLATHPVLTVETGLIRGLGLTALLLLHVILCIGPLCRLDRRFLPLLYNRRHLGVAMALVALGHAGFATFQFHALGDRNPLVSLLTSNRAFGSLSGFPFELLGLLALLILLLMAATSHDFWLSVLTPPVWKALHMLVYVAYALLIGHVALGAMQAEPGYALPAVLGAGAVLVIGLHLAAGLREARGDRGADAPPGGWVDAGAVGGIPEGRARVAMVAGERVAIFRHGNALSGVSNVCRHQHGPLGEGKIVDGCITCPWHGYQYRPDTGTSPPPFDDRVPTYRLRIEGGRVLVDPAANPPGTRVEPVPVPAPAPTDPSPFYVGYLDPSPAPLARHTRRAAAAMALVTGAAIVVLAVAQAPFAASAFEYGVRRELTGTLTARPYPVLTADSAGTPRQYLLAAPGKHGAGPLAAPFEGRLVRLAGSLIARGNARMLEVASLEGAGTGAGTPGSAAPGPGLPAQVPLGRYSLTGEIVDSKCWTGVMNPGEGKTHLGCAVRCLSGGLPPLLALRDSAGHEEHLILTDERGAPMPGTLLPLVGRPVRVSGMVIREGDLLFMRADPSGMQLLAK